MLANRGSGGALGSGSGALGSRSGGVGAPAGALGSKNPSGLNSVAIRSRFFAASPASRKPGLSPMRGSFGGAGLCCAAPSSASRQNIAQTYRILVALIPETPLTANIRLGPTHGSTTYGKPSTLLKFVEHRAHPVDLHPLIGNHVRRERKDLHLLARARYGKQLVHHGQRSGVVFDHPLEEKTIEL